MNTIITASEVQKGDKIKVTLPEIGSGDRKYTVIYEGVADSTDGIHRNGPIWRTKESWNLYVHEDGAVIELLDRPKPKIVIPTNTFAQVTYLRHGMQRFAVLTPNDGWKVYDKDGDWADDQTASGMDHVANENAQVSDFKVIFAGVAK